MIFSVHSDVDIDTKLIFFSGEALAAGGPGTLLLAEALSCAMLYFILDPLTEMMLYEPSGSFISFAYRYTDAAWAFAVGWIYVFHGLAAIPLDIIVAAKVVQAILPSINIAVWLSTFIFAVVAVVFLKPVHFMQICILLGFLKFVFIAGIGFVVSCCLLLADQRLIMT